jgi:hypothetical protein
MLPLRLHAEVFSHILSWRLSCQAFRPAWALMSFVASSLCPSLHDIKTGLAAWYFCTTLQSTLSRAPEQYQILAYVARYCSRLSWRHVCSAVMFKPPIAFL